MNLYIIVLLSLLNIFNFFDIVRINSHQETKINLNKSKTYVIFEFLNKPKYFKHQYFDVIPSPILHIYFKKGNQINTNYYVYYDKDKIQLDNNKFINSNYNSDLYGKNRTWIQNEKSEKIYIVVSNFRSDNYEDTITVFNCLDYTDITTLNNLHFDIYFNLRPYEYSR